MKISFSGTLLRFVNYQKTVEVDAVSVNDGIKMVAEMFPQSGGVLYDADMNVKEVHQIFLNGKRLLRDQLNEEASPDDKVDIITAIAGG